MFYNCADWSGDIVIDKSNVLFLQIAFSWYGSTACFIHLSYRLSKYVANQTVLDKYLQQSLVLIYSQQLAWLPTILKSFAKNTNVMRDGSRPFLGATTFNFN